MIQALLLVIINFHQELVDQRFCLLQFSPVSQTKRVGDRLLRYSQLRRDGSLPSVFFISVDDKPLARREASEESVAQVCQGGQPWVKGGVLETEAEDVNLIVLFCFEDQITGGMKARAVHPSGVFRVDCYVHCASDDNKAQLRGVDSLIEDSTEPIAQARAFENPRQFIDAASEGQRSMKVLFELSTQLVKSGMDSPGDFAPS